MTREIEIARMALNILRDSALGDGCQHPAEALDHVLIRRVFVCSVCSVGVTEEQVARTIADPKTKRYTFQSEPFPRAWIR